MSIAVLAMLAHENRFVLLAHRFVIEAWTLEQAKAELLRLPRKARPTYVEMDDTRDRLAGSEFPFELAVAVDALFDIGVPGIPDDADHNPGNVHFLLAGAWLARARLGEERGKPYFWRHCRLSREFYARWKPLVPGASGHPAWADVLQLEAEMLLDTTDVIALRKANSLLEKARRCYPADQRYWPVLVLEATVLESLATHERAEVNLRSALFLIQQAYSCLNVGTSERATLFHKTANIWQRLSSQSGFRSADRAQFDEFVAVSLAELDPASATYQEIQKLRYQFMKPTYAAEPASTFNGRLRHLISRLIHD